MLLLVTRDAVTTSWGLHEGADATDAAAIPATNTTTDAADIAATNACTPDDEATDVVPPGTMHATIGCYLIRQQRRQNEPNKLRKPRPVI